MMSLATIDSTTPGMGERWSLSPDGLTYLPDSLQKAYVPDSPTTPVQPTTTENVQPSGTQPSVQSGQLDSMGHDINTLPKVTARVQTANGVYITANGVTGSKVEDDVGTGSIHATWIVTDAQFRVWADAGRPGQYFGGDPRTNGYLFVDPRSVETAPFTLAPNTPNPVTVTTPQGVFEGGIVPIVQIKTGELIPTGASIATDTAQKTAEEAARDAALAAATTAGQVEQTSSGAVTGTRITTTANSAGGFADTTSPPAQGAVQTTDAGTVLRQQRGATITTADERSTLPPGGSVVEDSGPGMGAALLVVAVLIAVLLVPGAE